VQPGSGVDDVAVLLGQHDVVGGLGAVYAALEVDVDQPVPVLERELVGVAHHPDAGIVEDEVELAGLLRHFPVERLGGGVVADVEGGRLGHPAGSPDASYNLRCELDLQVRNPDVRPPAGEFLGQRPSDA
jgi:hypothetical protein